MTKEPFTVARARAAAAKSTTAALAAGALVGTAAGALTSTGTGVAAGVLVTATALPAALAAVRLRVTDPRA